MRSSAPAHVVIIGGGISGLTAAWQLARRARSAGHRLAITVLEASERLGGQLDSVALMAAGPVIDVGAESLLIRPGEDAEQLLADIGLADELAASSALRAAIHTHGALHPLPTSHVMGIPAGDRALRELIATGLISTHGVQRAQADLTAPASPLVGDVPLGPYLRERIGDELVDLLISPLLAGVYGGHPDQLSLEATLPLLYRLALAGESSIIASSGHLLHPAGDEHGRGGTITPAATELPTPVIAEQPGTSLPSGARMMTLKGGLATLPHVLAEHLRTSHGVQIHTRTPVRRLDRHPETHHNGGRQRWNVVIDGRPGRAIEADAIIVATPAPTASSLVAEHAPAAAAALSDLQHVGITIVSLAFLRSDWPTTPAVSGYLVPAVEGRAVKAVTFSFVKWPHLAAASPELMLVRLSLALPRLAERAAETPPSTDEDLITVAAAELKRTMGVRGRPIAAHITRWHPGLPQYVVGHRDRVRQIRRALAGVPDLAVCGTAYDGVGISACITAAVTAAAQTWGSLNRHDHHSTITRPAVAHASGQSPASEPVTAAAVGPAEAS
ncbi:protoporphyrinogen oxidase [Nonomuraea sp. NPDC050663]|uniref:protoporphyrinogen oxidase n=1 Tax=Nonomuraea sp. NPDC050663 TaxID=3364370 RepID=UPI003788D218